MARTRAKAPRRKRGEKPFTESERAKVVAWLGEQLLHAMTAVQQGRAAKKVAPTANVINQLRYWQNVVSGIKLLIHRADSRVMTARSKASRYALHDPGNGGRRSATAGSANDH